LRGLERQRAAEERDDMLLEADGNVARVRPRIDVERIRDAVLIEGRYRFSSTMYWSMNASGALAAHFARTACAWSPIGRSRYSGGFFGFGDQAAADASCARRANGSFAESAG